MEYKRKIFSNIFQEPELNAIKFMFQHYMYIHGITFEQFMLCQLKPI